MATFPEPIPPNLEQELTALIRTGHTVAAIKKLREESGVTLDLCKKWIEEQVHEIVRDMKKQQIRL